MPTGTIDRQPEELEAQPNGERFEPTPQKTAVPTSERALIIGSGGREDAIGRVVARQSRQVFFGPGNAGTSEYGINIANFDAPAIASLNPDLTIIGPEVPLIDGLADRLRERGLNVFGPNAAAAELEGSKAFAVRFMERHGIDHPETRIFTSIEESIGYAYHSMDGSYVIKEDGPRAGKGVYLPKNYEEARQIVERVGDSGEPLLFQERLHGPELSVFVLSDGENWTILPYAQDHKRLKDGDQGPNTGGMGAYAPADFLVTEGQKVKIEEIAARTIDGMQRESKPYQGVLYIGIMLAEENDGDPVVIEYNVRFGDPETQVLMPLLVAADVDINDVLLRTDRHNGLKGFNNYLIPNRLGGSALTVCLAAKGYPEKPITGDEILLDTSFLGGVILHHAGVALDNVGRKIVAGGRVMYVTAVGDTIDKAAGKAYNVIKGKHIEFPGMQYRDDIGHQARRFSM